MRLSGMAFVLAALVAPGPLAAHEFWIEPQAFAVAPGAPLVADLLVGERLEGARYGYVPPNFTRFDVLLGGAAHPVEGRPGDRPALSMAVEGSGLAVVVHVTRDYKLTYNSWDKFESFLADKDLSWVAARHDARGLPRDSLRERYSRHAKSLIAVGDGQGADREAGLLTEIVAQANPYTDDLSGGLPVRVLYRGAPRADTQVTVFARDPGGAVSVATYRTDAGGRAVIEVAPGHVYLVDSVVMRELEVAGPNDPAWESLWASLTFRVPE
ncbi:DUF4198 domain-containing protein [Ponticoccus sp. (in: a-proteobacteria)]|uniref:DUF4198 domain-containing protein n=1 Tax=Ponticoccus sp. (in: a-proteobacteria) TaxID=1925025 RepID=UPI003AB75FA8